MGDRIVLIGPMGCGKSTIGRLLAARLRCSFLDSDAIIVRQTGVDIPTIFAIEGESGFREREHKVLQELSQREDSFVLATGGGAILRPDNRPLLRNIGEVIHLDISIDEQMKRIRHDRNRPLLQVDDLPARLAQLAEERAPLYQEVAHWRIFSDGLRADQVLSRILRHRRERARSRS
ncbi:MAG: shikimate kinase [Acidithiobacillus sp.]